MVIIGLSTNKDQESGTDSMPPDYISAVLNAGALPVIFPMIPQDHPQYQQIMEVSVDLVDGLIITGGPDVDPAFYREERLPGLGDVSAERDKADLTLIQMALAKKKPLLGICRGLQAVNIAMGGSLYQDLKSQWPSEIDHQRTDKAYAHPVSVKKGSLLHQITGKEELMVTSRHHQASKLSAPGLAATAFANDGVVEALEFENGYPGLLVQWHPENIAMQDESQQALFNWLVKMAEQA